MIDISDVFFPQLSNGVDSLKKKKFIFIFKKYKTCCISKIVFLIFFFTL